MSRARKPLAGCTANGEITLDWAMKAKALLAHLYLDQMGVEHDEIDVWHKDHPEDRRTFKF